MDRKPGHIPLPPPTTIKEALERLRDTERQVRVLTVQLQAHDRKDSSGRRLDPSEYRAWQTKAKMKRAHMQSTASELRDWIKMTRRRRGLNFFEGGTPKTAVEALEAVGRMVRGHGKAPSDYPLSRILAVIDSFLETTDEA
jgi:hypothetical protein